MTPALVILAAGVGSRYGGPKQIEPVGPAGATLLDYSIYDARRAGFGTVVVVTRPELATAFDRIDATVAIQRLDDIPNGLTMPAARTKPWGTGHAVLAAATAVSSPFAVVNADDFYGRDAFTRAAEFLAGLGGEAPASFAIIAYPLRDTLSAAGGVNRAVCHADGDGWLETVEEVVDIRRLDDDTYAGTDAHGRPVRLSGDALVSMNLWAFTPAVFTVLRRAFAEFLRPAGGEGQGEFLISHAIRDAVRRGEARVRLLSTRARWLGVTYPDDRPRVAAALRQLVAAGEYPERLWG
ncbi:MAG TPA: NTP transferase domain-containing protein [Gemmatimonadales bacterium]